MSMSRLTGAQRRLLKVVVVVGIFMLADTLYLLCFRLADWFDLRIFALTETSLPGLYQAMVLSHTGVGLALAGIAIVFALWHLTRVWIRRRNRTALFSGLLVLTLGLALAVSGLFILTEANSRDNRWAFWAHAVCAVLVPALYLAHRRASVWKPTRRACRVGIGATAGLTGLLVLLHGVTYREDHLTEEAVRAIAAGKHTGPGSKGRSLEGYVDEAGFVAAGYVPPESPFFPSAATTTTGDFLPSRIITRGDVSHPEALKPDLERYGFVVHEKIGAETCKRCHADIVAQWAVSAHRFASFNNPFYEATVNDMRRAVGNEKSKWCSGCHDPALMLAGMMSGEIDRTSPTAQAGLTCLACHAMDQIHNRTGNGNYNIADAQEDPYLFPDAKSGIGRVLHDAAVKAKPTVHKRQMLKPFFRTADYCATCHKVSLDVPVNDYRWLRGQDEFDAWHDSGVSHNASRTFYLPSAKRVCQDCHMPPEKAVLGDVSARSGYVRSHRFTAVNTALPYVRGDEGTIRRIEAFLRDEKLRVDVFALRRGPGFEAPIAPLDRVVPPLMAGEEVQVEVVVRNQGVGHTFPGGTNDSNEGWLEVALLDEGGRPVGVSGFVREDGYVDPGAHFYRALILDRHSGPIHRRNAQDIYTAVYVNVIGPGTADVARYRFRVPEAQVGRTLTLRARLLWRKFDRAYTEFAYRANPAGFRAFDAVPDLPITEIAVDEMRLSVLASGVGERAAGEVGPVSEDWVRFNDYGIGLMLQGETRASTWAFRKVVDAAPERIDGYRNLARAAVQDGDLKVAYGYLRKCEAIAPGNAQTAWVWGVVLQEEGRYDEAAAAYSRLLQDFPEDRAAWRNLGRVRYLNGQFEGALQALDRALAIDPEDRAANYHQMLALRALGRRREAAAAEKAYLKYQIDESAKAVTQAYLLDHPEDEREAQKIHIHQIGLQVPKRRRPGTGGGG